MGSMPFGQYPAVRLQLLRVNAEPLCLTVCSTNPKRRNYSPERGADLVALDDSLEALAAVDPRKSKVVELKFFGGLKTEEIAEVLRVSPQTVLRDWKLAKSWLVREMKKGRSNGS